MSFWQYFQQVIDRLKTPLDVDILASEHAVCAEVDTAVASSPYTILVPSFGKCIETRGVYLYTDSTSGEIEAKYQSGSLLGKLYCSKFAVVSLDKARFQGTINEPIIATWTGVDSGAKFYYVIRYKEVEP